MYSIYSNISDIRKREKEFARNQKLFNVDYLKSLSSSDVWSVRLGDIVRKEIEFEYACILGAYETGIWADRQLVQNQWDNIVINTYHADNNLDSFTTHSHIIIKHKNELHHLSFRKYGLTFLQENETQCHKDRNVLIDIRSRRRL